MAASGGGGRVRGPRSAVTTGRKKALPTLPIESWQGPGGTAVAGYRVCRIPKGLSLMDWVLPAAVVPHKARAPMASLGGACSSDGGLVEKVEGAGRAYVVGGAQQCPGDALSGTESFAGQTYSRAILEAPQSRRRIEK